MDITEIMAEVGFEMAMDKGEEVTKLRAEIEKLRQVVQYEIDVVEAAKTEIERLLSLLSAIRDRDIEYNYFDRPSGGWIRQQINAALEQSETAGNRVERTDEALAGDE